MHQQLTINDALPHCLYLSDTPVARRDYDDGCLHVRCRIAAGYRNPVSAYNASFRGELTNWLRFASRSQQAAAYWAGKKDWRNRGRPVEDAFSIVFVWMGLVGE